MQDNRLSLDTKNSPCSWFVEYMTMCTHSWGQGLTVSYASSYNYIFVMKLFGKKNHPVDCTSTHNNANETDRKSNIYSHDD